MGVRDRTESVCWCVGGGVRRGAGGGGRHPGQRKSEAEKGVACVQGRHIAATSWQYHVQEIHYSNPTKARMGSMTGQTED